MEELSHHEQLKQFRFLGKHIALFISDMIENGVEHTSIIRDSFNYDRWLKSQKKGKVKFQQSKSDVVSSLLALIREHVEKYLENIDVAEMLRDKKRQFFQQKVYYELQGSHYADAILSVLRKSVKIYLIGQLSRALQEEVIHWVFRNEDRVWRYRGGRDGYETLEQYMSFLEECTQGDGLMKKAFPGIVVVSDTKADKNTDCPLFETREIVGYVVGEYINRIPVQNEEEDEEDEEEEELTDNDGSDRKDCYEIVTAWVDPKYRGLNLSIDMYRHVISSTDAKYVTCDVISGGVNRMLKGNVLMTILGKIGLMKFLLTQRSRSYLVQTQSGEEEQFERLVLRRWPVAMALRLSRVFSNLWARVTLGVLACCVVPLVTTVVWHIR